MKIYSNFVFKCINRSYSTSGEKMGLKDAKIYALMMDVLSSQFPNIDFEAEMEKLLDGGFTREEALKEIRKMLVK